MLFDGGVRKGVLSPRRFAALIETEKIEFPDITEEEIKDRSKGDGLSKGLVLIQVAWFVVQFSARIVGGLAITQLELAMFALAILNGIMYFFWWNKPLDVRLPIPVHLLRPMEQINEDLASQSGNISPFKIKREIFTTTSLAISSFSEPETESLDVSPQESDQHIHTGKRNSNCEL